MDVNELKELKREVVKRFQGAAFSTGCRLEITEKMEYKGDPKIQTDSLQISKSMRHWHYVTSLTHHNWVLNFRRAQNRRILLRLLRPIRGT